MAWTTAPDGTQIWQEITPEQSELLPPVPETDPDPSDWVTQTGGLSNMTELEYQATITAMNYRDETKVFRDEVAGYMPTITNAYQDILIKYADIDERHGDIIERQGQINDTAQQVNADKVQTGQDRVVTGQDRAQTALDRVATAADRVQTGEDRTVTGQDRAAVAADRQTAVQARDTATGAAATAVGAQNVAEGYRDQAYQARTDTYGARDAAEGYATTAGTHAYNAQAARTGAETFAGEALGYRNEAKDFRDQAATLVATVDMTNYYTKTQSDTRYKAIGYAPDWGDITGKPTEYAPTAHMHTKSQITDFPTTWAWASLTGVPTVVTQTEAETGTSSTSRMWTAQRVRQSANKAIVDAALAPAAHTHTKSQITDFAHTHTKSQITDFAHTHPISEVTNLQTTLNNKPNFSDLREHGGVEIYFISTTQIGIRPRGDGCLIVNGESYPVVAATLPNTSFTDSTLQFVYAYVSGSALAYEVSSTTHATLPSGVEGKFGSTSRSLIGAVCKDGANFRDDIEFRGIGNWFNQRKVVGSINFPFTGTSSATTTVWNYPVQMIIWGRQGFNAMIDATVTCNNGVGVGYLGVDVGAILPDQRKSHAGVWQAFTTGAYGPNLGRYAGVWNTTGMRVFKPAGAAGVNGVYTMSFNGILTVETML